MKTSRRNALIAIGSLLAATLIVFAAVHRTSLTVRTVETADGVSYEIKIGDRVVADRAPADDTPPQGAQPTTGTERATNTFAPTTTIEPTTNEATTDQATTDQPTTTEEATTLPPAATEQATTTVAPDPVPSGIPMPLNAPANFPRTVMREDFNTPAPEGQFLEVYEPRNISAYPDTYRDTRSGYVKASNRMNYGTYDPNIISVPEGSGYMQLSLRTIDKSIRVAAPVPFLDPTNTEQKWHDAKNVRVSICWKADVLDTRKVAWMLWPGSGTNTTGASAGRKNAHGRYIGGNGEIDFPEADLDGIDTISAFVHWQNGTSGDSRTIMPSPVSAAGSGWHVTTIEWLAGVSFTSWLDGNLVGTLTGAQVPAEPMHLVLQTETILDTSKKLQSVTGNVYVDWITIETV